MGLETIHWHTLEARYLSERSRVIDLGANYGRFSQAMVRRFGCECVAVEPSPKVFEAMPVESGRIRKFNMAIAAVDGSARFNVSEQSTASSMTVAPEACVESVTVRTQRLDEFVKELGWECVDVIKFDIEGAEIEVLDSVSDEFLRTIGQLTVEFHDFCGITPPTEVQRVLRRLEGLGFLHVRMSRVGHQDTWLINWNRCSISHGAFIWSKLVTRNWRGLKRVVRRSMKRHG
jgi:FkbM family methyltransferase